MSKLLSREGCLFIFHPVCNLLVEFSENPSRCIITAEHWEVNTFFISPPLQQPYHHHFVDQLTSKLPEQTSCKTLIKPLGGAPSIFRLILLSVSVKYKYFYSSMKKFTMNKSQKQPPRATRASAMLAKSKDVSRID